MQPDGGAQIKLFCWFKQKKGICSVLYSLVNKIADNYENSKTLAHKAVANLLLPVRCMCSKIHVSKTTVIFCNGKKLDEGSS